MDAFIVFCLAFQVTEAFNKLLVFRESRPDYWTLVCAAEDNGDAFVWNTGQNLNWKHGTAFKNPYANVSEVDCFEPYNKCKWNYEHYRWIETNWKQNPMGPVLDSRWEDFRENNNTSTSNTYEYIDTLPSKGALAFSIRGSKDGDIRLCKNKNYHGASCYGITIKMKFISLQTPSSKGNSNKIENKLSPTEWQHYILKWDNNKRNITLYSDKKQLLTAVYPEKLKNLKEFNLLHKISDSMHIRYHNYTYLYTKQKSHILYSPWLEFKNNNVCIRLSIGLCTKCNVEISLHATSGFHYKETLKTVNGILTTHGLPMWQLVQINMTVLNPRKNDSPLIQIVPTIKDNKDNTEGFWAVRNIVKCPPAGTMKIGSILYNVKPQPKNKKNILPDAACQRISSSDNEVVNTNVDTAPLEPDDYDCPNGKLCSISCNSFYRDFNEDCQNIVICNTKGCTCHTGFTGSYCKNLCDDDKYGYMCNKTCGQCRKGQCNYKTGLCIDQLCDNDDAYHIPPYCDIKIQYPPAPNITSVNETSVHAKIIAKDEYKKTRVQYTFVIKNANNTVVYKQPYETIFQNTTTLEVRRDKLEPGKHYWVSCNLILENGKFVLNGSWTDFKTPCTVYTDFKIDTGLQNLTITSNIKEKMLYPCPFDSYNVKILEFGTQKIIREKHWVEMPLIFKGLEPGTVYEVFVSDQNNTNNKTSTTCTKDGISSPVENVQYDVFNSSSVSIKWEKPKKPNGKIKEYQITLNITTYNGCSDLKRNTRPSKFVSARTNITNIRFHDLQPYITYTAIIYAWNSNQGRAAFANFSTGSTKIPRSKYTNLRKKNNKLLWDPPKDCSIISGPIDASRLEFTGVSKTIKNCTPVETIVYENSFDITGTELYGRETYEVFVYPVRGIEEIYNNSTYVHLKFDTPAKAPPKVRQLEIVEVDIRTNSILLRWQEPFPPNGKLDHYKVANCISKTCTFYIKNVPKNQYCPLWYNYICVTIDQDLSKKFQIAVYAINENVKEDGEYAYASYNSSEVVSDQPGSLTAVVYPKTEMVKLNWSHPWKTRLPIKEFVIQMNVISTKLRQGIHRNQFNYPYTIMKYERTYTMNFSLMPSTLYEFLVYPVTIDGNYGECNRYMYETSASMAFQGNLTYRFKSDSIICLQIPKITNDTINSKIYVVVKGNNACEGYVQLNQFLKRYANVESNEIAWLAANSSTNEYIRNEICIGDNSTNAANCPLRKKDFYTVIVIVQADENSTNEGIISTLIQFGNIRHIRRHVEMWAIPIVIMLIVIAVMFYFYRRFSKWRIAEKLHFGIKFKSY